MGFVKDRPKVFLAIIVSLAFCVGSYIVVSAAGYVGTVYGRASWYGYFQNIKDTNWPDTGAGDGSYVLSIKSDGLAIPYYIDTYEELIDLLRGYNDSGSAKNKVGSAFIVNTMLGRDGQGFDTDVSDEDWATLTAILKDRSEKPNKIIWRGNVDNAPTNINSYYQGVGSGSNPNDDAFNAAYKNEEGIKIINDDGSSYQLLRRCANPIGRLSGLTKVVQWSAMPGVGMYVNHNLEFRLDANSGDKDIDVNVGDYIGWRNLVTFSNGNASVAYSAEMSGSWGGSILGGNTDVNVDRALFSESLGNNDKLITSSDVGKSYCLATHLSPSSYNNSAETFSGWACAKVISNYTITPTVSINTSNVIESGAPVSVTPTIKNSGPSDSSDTSWKLTRSVNGASLTYPESGNQIFATGSTTLGAYKDEDTNYPAGTKICYWLQATPHSSTDSNPINSANACVTIGKKPKVQIWGGNLVSGANVSTSATIKTSKNGGLAAMFGSWTEYGIFAAGSISGMASGSAFASESGSTDYSSVCRYSTLSFTNVSTGGTACSPSSAIGHYTGFNTTSDVAASFSEEKNAITSSSIVADNLLPTGGIYIGNKTGDLTLDGGTLAAGKSVILKVNGTVTIDGNQFYEDKTYTKGASELPQLIIIANNINITDNVTNIDAWLIATDGNINTCSNFSGNLTISKCAQLLTVNGPVSAKKLLLYRTAGSGTDTASGNPAEIFNLRADAYLWSAAHIEKNTKIQSVYTTELPPRF